MIWNTLLRIDQSLIRTCTRVSHVFGGPQAYLLQLSALAMAFGIGSIAWPEMPWSPVQGPTGGTILAGALAFRAWMIGMPTHPIEMAIRLPALALAAIMGSLLLIKMVIQGGLPSEVVPAYFSILLLISALSVQERGTRP